MLRAGIEVTGRPHRRWGLLAAVLAGLWAGAGHAQGTLPGDPADDVLSQDVIRIDVADDDRRRPGQGDITIVAVQPRPLREILAFLSRRSGINIVVKQDELAEERVSLELRRVHWETVLEVLAAKYKLIVDKSQMIRSRLIFVDRPKLITRLFKDTPLRDVIEIIAEEAEANIFLGDAVKDTMKVRARFEKVPWRTALEVILKTHRLILIEEKFDILRVADMADLQTQVETRIFRLSYLIPGGSRYVAKIESPYLQKTQTQDALGQSLGQSTSLIDVVQKVLTDGKGKLAFEKRTNSLIVVDTPDKLNSIQKIIERLDIPPKQVHLSMRLIELNDSDADSVGINWGQNGLTFSINGMQGGTMFPFLGHSNRSPFNPGTLGNIFTDLPQSGLLTEARGLGSPFPLDQLTGTPQRPLIVPTASDVALGRLSFTQLSAVLNLIKTFTRGKVIQAPQLIALDNEEATILVGELVRYAESFVQTIEGGGLASGFREASNSPLTLGLQLLVIPHVTGPDNNILLTVIPKLEELDIAEPFITFNSSLGDLKLPQTKQRFIVTKMILRNGETAVVGGLRRETEGTTITKVPLLGDIPILGWLFRHRQTSKDHLNLLMFITPTVIDLEQSNELGDQINAINRGVESRFETYE